VGERLVLLVEEQDGAQHAGGLGLDQPHDGLEDRR